MKSIFLIFGYSIRLEIIDDETTITYDNTYEVPLKIGAYTIYVACSSPSQSRTGSATYVTTIPVYINYNGTMKAMDKAYINNNGSMKECTIYVRVGDTIKALN